MMVTPIQPPMLTKAAPAVQRVTPTAAASRTPMVDKAFTAPSQISKDIDMTPEPSGPVDVGNLQPMSSSAGPVGALAIGAAVVPPAVTVVPKAKPAVLRISEGMTRGMLIHPITPAYPPIARATHTQGAVVVTAIISKSGTIESLQVISGPDMLRNAALDAIRAARYQPYLLNGEPTEVQTTITINFTMGG